MFEFIKLWILNTNKHTKHRTEKKDVTSSKSVLPPIALIICFAVIAVLQQCLGGLQRGVALTQRRVLPHAAS